MRQALWAACALVLGALVASALMALPGADPSAAEDDATLAALSQAEVRGGVRVASGVLAPTWEVGDAWRVQFDDNDPICWLVVVSATAEGYEQGVWCPTDEAELIAAQIAAYEFPYLGRFSERLDGLGADGDFQYYDWPLEDGKSWTTSWYDEDVEVVAEQLRDGRWSFTATFVDSEETLMTYDYDPELAWWSALEFPATGYVLAVHERETGWEGPVVHARGEDRYEGRRTASVLGAPAVVFGVEEDDAMVALMIDWSGTPVGRFEVRDGDGDAMFQQTMAGDAEDVFELLPGAVGTWSIVDGVTGLADAMIRVRGIAVDVVQLG